MSLFIVFEGGEGSGKSTQARALQRRLRQADIRAVLTHEPGGTVLGKRVRRWLKEVGRREISPLAELLLFAACRAELVTQVIRPNLEKGMAVISDRFADSSVAYQGYGRGLEINTIQEINSIATRGVSPHLVILLDIPVELGLSRKGAGKDRFESEDFAFHQRVRQGYLEMAKASPQRWLVVDASLPRAGVEEIVWEGVSRLIKPEGNK